VAAAAAAGRAFKVTLLVPADDPRLTRSAPGARRARPPVAARRPTRWVALEEGSSSWTPPAQRSRSTRAESPMPPPRGLPRPRPRKPAPPRWSPTCRRLDPRRRRRRQAAGDQRSAPRRPPAPAADCRKNLLHTGPSERMRADAMAQTLVRAIGATCCCWSARTVGRRATAARSAAAAIQRYGLKLVGRKPFKLSADPRERDLANPLLLTGTLGGRLRRGVGGRQRRRVRRQRCPTAPPCRARWWATAVWWRWPGPSKFERFGAPQVTRRLTKAAGRPMDGA
jgi:hypothetical protein